MNEYAGKVCPYCKTEFRPGDDIVQCSQCDMPHHKDCWIDNQGCTTFGCLGTIEGVDQAGSAVIATQMNYDDHRSAADGPVVFCTRCGAKNSGTDSFCIHCGNRLAVIPPRAPQPPVYTQANPTGGYGTDPFCEVDEDVQRLVFTNTEYYLPRFRTMKSRGSMATWNWPAFLVTPYWMMYRKMYGYAAAVLVADLVISLIGSAYLSLLAFGGYIAFGILGNYIYMKFLEKKADQAKALWEPHKTQFMTVNGGVNLTAVILAVIGRIVLFRILSA